MAHSKDELKNEMRAFMHGFACSIERVYCRNAGSLIGHAGTSAQDIELADAVVEDTSLWKSVMTMYDYGVCGIPSAAFGKDEGIDSSFADAELFLRGLDSLELYLEEDQVSLPKLARRTVRMAVARHVLEGGSRYTDYEDGNWYYLSFGELALLADMDERSVRNAANPKLPGALITESVGKRTMVTIEEARRWLAGRKGFVPTLGATRDEVSVRAQQTSVILPSPLLARINAHAKEAGVNTQDYLEMLLNHREGRAQ